MPTILDNIVAAKGEELARQKEVVPLAALERRIAGLSRPLSLRNALSRPGIQLIAEVKKASPSRGLLCPDFDPVRLARTYTANGAATVSVLTDPRFQGELEHLTQIKESGASGDMPVLRKDFIFDPYQVYEARAIGADAILLIVAILTPEQLKGLLELAGQLNLQCLVEVHDPAEVQSARDAGAQIIGINNRDLRTFVTDVAVTEQLAPRVPSDCITVSESGISTPEHLRRLAPLGIDAVLVGEALVTNPDVGAKVRELTSQTVSSR